jgi:3-oxoacyl-[acyl-carrier protein] reductase
MKRRKTAIVTGGAQGIGKAIALALAREDIEVAIFDLGEETEEVVSEIEKMGGQARAYRVDVSREQDVEDAVKRFADDAGGIDILVNNAGIIHRGHFLDVDAASWNRVLAVNLGGTFFCSKAVVPYMIKQGGGNVVNISSIAGKMGDITASPAYGTSKGAINTLTKSMARQLAEYHITVNAVAPHAIETPMSAQWSEEKRKAIIESIPLKRLGRPEEVAAAVLFLVSEGAGFITGAVIDVNGGFLMD